MKHIKIMGLGVGELKNLPLGIYEMIVQSSFCYTRTIDHPVITELQGRGIAFHSFDEVYEKHDKFEDVYEEIVQFLINETESETILYTVPGHPLVAEKTIQLLIEQEKAGNCTIEIVGGQSFIDDMFTSLRIDPIEGFQFLDATSFQKDELQIRQHMIFCQVYDAFVASDLKLVLMDLLPYDYNVTIVTAAGTSIEQKIEVPLCELDHKVELNNLTSVYVPPVKSTNLLYKDFANLRNIISTLRGPNGCPWDKKQTNESLRKYLIEEAYELIDAIDSQDDDAIIEELGDVLLQVLLHAQIGEDEGYFSIDDVIEGVSKKMIRRHPHVFGDETANDSEEVVGLWKEIKKQEKGEKEASILDHAIKSGPSLQIAYEIQKKAAEVGFDWNEPEPIWEKIQEEIKELQDAILNKDETEMENELGDILFSVINIARFYKISPELALHKTNQKFRNRFVFVESCVEKGKGSFEQYTLDELDVFWEEAKKK